MRFISSVALGLLMLGLIGMGVQAQDKDKKSDKAVTLKGTIGCTKCELAETDACGHYIKVKDGGKELIYYFIDKGAGEKYHAKICGGPAKGSVTGVVSEKDKKKLITPAKDGVKYD